MSSTTYHLYASRRCFNTKLIQVANKFSNTKLEINYLENLSESNIQKLVTKSPTGTFPLLQIGETFYSGTLAISKLILSNNHQISEILYPNDSKKRALNDTWIDFTSYSVWPFYDEIIGQITGKLDANNEIFTTAISDLIIVLKKIDKHLTFKSFLVDHQVSFADIVLTTALHPYFTLVLDEKTRESLPNLTRWFMFVSGLNELTTVLGRARLCFLTQKPAVIPLARLTEPIPSKPKQQNQPVQKIKSEDKSNEDDQVKPKPKNALDLLPPTNLDLDSFKKEFLNTTEKQQSLKKLWGNYDNAGWSIWFLYYNKSSDQGRITFKTCNLKSNFLQVSLIILNYLLVFSF